MIQNFLLLEMELTYVRPHEIEKRLELARQIREAEGYRSGLRERWLLLVGDWLILVGHGLKARHAPFGECVSAVRSTDSIPSGS